MIELTGAGNLGTTIVKNLLTSFKSSRPNIPSEFWTEFENGVRPEELVETLVPIYTKNLTLEEVRAANTFYSSPAGQSVIKKLPLVMADAMQAGQQWGEKLAKQAIEKLQAKGLLPNSVINAQEPTPPSIPPRPAVPQPREP